MEENMTPQLIALVIYIISLSVVAPFIWMISVPIIRRLANNKNWLGLIVFCGMVIASSYVWYQDFGLPVTNNLIANFSVSIWKWFVSILVWPTAILAGIFLLKEEWQK